MALIALIIVGYAFIERFNPHRTVGVVLADNFHLTGRTAVIVKDTLSNARAGARAGLAGAA